MTASTIATRLSFRARLQSLMVLGNLGGGVLTFLYFHYVDPMAVSGGVATTGAEIAYFVIAFGLLSVIGRHLAKRWLAPLTRAGTVPPPGPAGDTARRRALLLPTFVALASGGGWVAAAFIWGLFWPLLTGDLDLGRALRQMFGITFVAGPFVAATVFFGSERQMRQELPRLFPSGELSAVQVPRLRVRTRMLAAFLLLGLLPLAVLSVAALTRADALRTADAAAAAAIIYNLKLVVVVLALGGLVISVGLALLVSASVAQPLRDVQLAMAQVQRGGLDVRCAVVSNDEIGAVAEGFNSMVQGLREREARIRLEADPSVLMLCERPTRLGIDRGGQLIDFWVRRDGREEMLLLGHDEAEQPVPDQIDGVALRVIAPAELAAANIWVTNRQRMLPVINATRTLLPKSLAKSIVAFVREPVALACIQHQFPIGDPPLVRGVIFELLRTGRLRAPALHTRALSLQTLLEPAS